jgi:hypothetical protein
MAADADADADAAAAAAAATNGPSFDSAAASPPPPAAEAMDSSVDSPALPPASNGNCLPSPPLSSHAPSIDPSPDPDSEEAREDTSRVKRSRVAEYFVSETVDRTKDQSLGFPTGKTITLDEIQRDRLTRIAMENWSVTLKEEAKPPFDASLVDHIYRNELLITVGAKPVPLQRVMLLEISQYLENYLWPNFDPETSTFEHLMSIILMVNEKVKISLLFSGLCVCLVNVLWVLKSADILSEKVIHC